MQNLQGMVGLRFLWGQQFFQIGVTQAKAAEIIKLFRNKSDAVVYDETETWGVRLSTISCVHMIDLEQVAAPPQGAAPPPHVPGAPPSGYPYPPRTN